jgi:protein tyrosine phosphatase (PTP) superfamily phosphohydrolase (DUF442 family)
MTTKATLCLLALTAIGSIAVATSCSASPSAAQPEITIAAPDLQATKSQDLPGLHNLVSYAPGIVGGSQPEGREGLHTLASMGIKTIVTVDGAAPDVEGAQQLGIQYVHLPISYDTVTPERQLQIAQALASCDGPIYVHCHHGKHRSSAALGTAMVLCGKLTPDQVKERMKVSGLSKDYTGLWAAVANARPMAPSELKVDPKTLPSVTKVSGMVGTMAEIDQVIDLVKQAHAAGWQAPKDHPDLVAPKETARLAALFANLKQDAESTAHPAEYQTLLDKSIAASAALDKAVRAADAATAEAQLTAINKGCKECHVLYRDK